MQPYTDAQLYKAIKEINVIDPKKLDDLYHECSKSQSSLYNLLLQQDLVSDENLGRTIASLLSVPYVNLETETIDTATAMLIPDIVAKKNTVLAFARNENGIKLAMLNPENKDIIDLLAKKTGEKIIVYYATERSFKSAMKIYDKELQSAFDELIHSEIAKIKSSSDADIPISNIVTLLIKYAHNNKASDIHVEPTHESCLARYRIDGILHDAVSLPVHYHEQIINKIKVLAKLRGDEHLTAQDGHIQITIDTETIDIRASIVPITRGEKAVLRLLTSHSRQFSFQELGISDKDIAKIERGYRRSYGMILSTGPTGSGKTTTIYSIIKTLNSREKNIATIEDPVEYDIEHINQIQVNTKADLTFANGLRAILRQDPDIIFVGEIRDKETAAIAVNSATTGHLVLSTLHTNDASTALPRLIDMEIEPFLVASTVNIIIGQRLIRKICSKCKHSQEVKVKDKKWFIDGEEKIQLSEMHTPLSHHYKKLSDIRFYAGKGCSVCYNSGYSGRIGIFEVLEITSEIRELITSKANAEQIMKQAVQFGMTTMLQDGLEKVDRGITTIDEVVSATLIT